MKKTDSELEGNGHSEEDVHETQEQLNTAYKKLSDFTRPDGVLVSLSPQQLSLLQKMLSTGTEEYREQQMWRMCDFMDEEEALDHVAAYYEAKELGMDTGPNVAYMFALCSTNRKGNKTNLMAMLTDTLQHVKYTDTTKRGKNAAGYSPRSPISG